MENKWKTSTVVLLVVALILSALLIVQYASEDKDFEVSFDSDGGTEIASQTVQKDAVVIRPADPQKDGFEFSYWELDNEKYDFSIPVTENLILKAVYTEATIGTADITLIFDDVYGTVNAISILEGELLLIEDPVREGYKFVRWESDGVEFDFTGSLSDGMKIYAVWEEIPRSVDKSALTSAVSSANQNLSSTSTSTDGSDIYTNNTWVTSAVKSVYEDAVAKAQAVLDDADATQEEIDAALAELDAATAAFNDAKKPGTMPAPSTTTAPTTTTTTTTTTKKADVYTYTFRRLDDFSPQYIITILKNGSAVGAAEVYDGNFLLGNRYNDKGVILIDGSELYNINRAKLNDGTNVNISK